MSERIAKFLEQLQQAMGKTKASSYEVLVCTPGDLVYDDQDLDQVLYGEPQDNLPPVSIFSGKHDLFPKEGDTAVLPLDVVIKGVELLNEGVPLSNGDLARLTLFARRCLPVWPHPPKEPISPRVGDLLDRLQTIARERANDDLRRDACLLRWEYHEWRGEYGLARDALAIVMQIYDRKGNEKEYGCALNNYAYQYQKERKWVEAAREYERAASIFKRIGDDTNYTNSQQNYWECRFEVDGLESVEFMKPEVERLVTSMHRRNDWRQRKGFLILAKIAEAENNLEDAVRLATLAVAVDKAANTIYLEQDSAYLAQLEEKTLRAKDSLN